MWPKQSLFVFCLISYDYLYPVIAITQTFIQYVLDLPKLENVSYVMVIDQTDF